MNILITEMMWPNGIEKLNQYGEVIYDPNLWSNEQGLVEKLSQADALIVRNQTKVNQDLLDQAPNLKVVGRLGVGLDNIDLNATKKRDIKVVYAKNANANSVAEYVFAAMFDASRSLSLANDDVQDGGWDRKRFTGSEISVKTLGLIGLGEIAQRVAVRANAFGMKVYGYDPFVSPYDFVYGQLGVQPSSLNELLRESDFVSIHVPLTLGTKNLIAKKQFAQMKSNAIIINTSRGGIIHEEDLLSAVNNQTIRGAYLDVIEQEPIAATNPLLSTPQIKLTPHIAGLTEESQIRTSELVADEIGKVLTGRQALCVV